MYSYTYEIVRTAKSEKKYHMKIKTKYTLDDTENEMVVGRGV
jgi:hypothetical protein